MQATSTTSVLDVDPKFLLTNKKGVLLPPSFPPSF